MVLRQMQYFVKVVDTMNFREAAEELFISASAVSQQMAALENELGVKLLKRKGRSFSVTPAGQYFYRKSLSILGQTENMLHETVRIGTDNEHRLRIGCLNLYRGTALRDTLLEFKRLYPEAELAVVSGNHEEIYRRMVDGDFNMVLNDQRRAFSGDYENFILSEVNIQAELAETHPLSQGDKANIETLNELNAILISSRAEYASDEQFFRDILGFSGSFIFAESMEEARLLVVSGGGFTLIESMGDDIAPMKGTRILPLYRNGRPITRNFCAFWPKERSGYYVEKFANLMRQMVAGER